MKNLKQKWKKDKYIYDYRFIFMKKCLYVDANVNLENHLSECPSPLPYS